MWMSHLNPKRAFKSGLAVSPLDQATLAPSPVTVPCSPRHGFSFQYWFPHLQDWFSVTPWHWPPQNWNTNTSQLWFWNSPKTSLAPTYLTNIILLWIGNRETFFLQSLSNLNLNPHVHWSPPYPCPVRGVLSLSLRHQRSISKKYTRSAPGGEGALGSEGSRCWGWCQALRLRRQCFSVLNPNSENWRGS